MAYNHGFDKYGYDWEGFDPKGYDRGGHNRDGYDRDGYNRDGYARDGYSRDGYNRDGYNRDGYDADGNISVVKWKEIAISTTGIADHAVVTWDINEYLELNEQDMLLAEYWAGDEKEDEYVMARMLSARAAEKIAKKFYHNLGFHVDDVSLTQIVNNANNDWMFYDLFLDNKICIDVKNARTSLNSKVTYVEHCVSKFKKNRNNIDIKIAGILSPYLKLKSIKQPWHEKEHIYFLGETSLSYLLSLEERFTNRFLKVSLGSMNFIPRWFFDYPDNFYRARDENRKRLRHSSMVKIPTISECDFNPVPAYISSKISLPSSWKNDLAEWQINFCSRLGPQQNQTTTLPVLFFVLLTHFLEAASITQRWRDYDPKGYRELLYTKDPLDGYSEPLEGDKYLDGYKPLGIHDPLSTISEFIDTLSILWNNKDKIDLDSFEHFKFNGLGLLQGKRLHHENYQTILAYCGGFIEGRGKCGNAPLIFGKNECCPQCGKLICEKCGYCSSLCSRFQKQIDTHRLS